MSVSWLLITFFNTLLILIQLLIIWSDLWVSENLIENNCKCCYTNSQIWWNTWANILQRMFIHLHSSLNIEKFGNLGLRMLLQWNLHIHSLTLILLDLLLKRVFRFFLLSFTVMKRIQTTTYTYMSTFSGMTIISAFHFDYPSRLIIKCKIVIYG